MSLEPASPWWSECVKLGYRLRGPLARAGAADLGALAPSLPPRLLRLLVAVLTGRAERGVGGGAPAPAGAAAATSATGGGGAGDEDWGLAELTRAFHVPVVLPLVARALGAGGAARRTWQWTSVTHSYTRAHTHTHTDTHMHGCACTHHRSHKHAQAHVCPLFALTGWSRRGR